mgnify:CR=1 FL=1
MIIRTLAVVGCLLLGFFAACGCGEQLGTNRFGFTLFAAESRMVRWYNDSIEVKIGEDMYIYRQGDLLSLFTEEKAGAMRSAPFCDMAGNLTVLIYSNGCCVLLSRGDMRGVALLGKVVDGNAMVKQICVYRNCVSILVESDNGTSISGYSLDSGELLYRQSGRYICMLGSDTERENLYVYGYEDVEEKVVYRFGEHGLQDSAYLVESYPNMSNFSSWMHLGIHRMDSSIYYVQGLICDFAEGVQIVGPESTVWIWEGDFRQYFRRTGALFSVGNGRYLSVASMFTCEVSEWILVNGSLVCARVVPYEVEDEKELLDFNVWSLEISPDNNGNVRTRWAPYYEASICLDTLEVVFTKKK